MKIAIANAHDLPTVRPPRPGSPLRSGKTLTARLRTAIPIRQPADTEQNCRLRTAVPIRQPVDAGQNCRLPTADC